MFDWNLIFGYCTGRQERQELLLSMLDQFLTAFAGDELRQWISQQDRSISAFQAASGGFEFTLPLFAASERQNTFFSTGTGQTDLPVTVALRVFVSSTGASLDAKMLLATGASQLRSRFDPRAQAGCGHLRILPHSVVGCLPSLYK